MSVQELNDWALEARCRDIGPQLFYDYDRVEEAKAFCQECVVKMDCISYALRTRQKNGVWGGMSEKEIASIIRLKQRNKLGPVEAVKTYMRRQALNA